MMKPRSQVLFVPRGAHADDPDVKLYDLTPGGPVLTERRYNDVPLQVGNPDDGYRPTFVTDWKPQTGRQRL